MSCASTICCLPNSVCLGSCCVLECLLGHISCLVIFNSLPNVFKEGLPPELTIWSWIHLQKYGTWIATYHIHKRKVRGFGRFSLSHWWLPVGWLFMAQQTKWNKTKHGAENFRTVNPCIFVVWHSPFCRCFYAEKTSPTRNLCTQAKTLKVLLWRHSMATSNWC